MAVTELAQLRLEPGASLGDPSLKSKLVKATKAMESFDGHPFYWYTQIEDPSIFYIVGSWTSVQRHRQEWLPSAANQELLELLSGLVIVDWMFHVQVAQDQLPLDAPVMAIGRHFIKPGAHVGFEETFRSVKHHVANYTAPRGVAGGWRVEKEAEDQEEWVLFAGWPDAAKHSEFAETPAFKEYARIKDFVERLEVKHATKMDL
ncbi:uncharacterized protein J3D65DRAFT_34741 [Phyllosticta citribraziliensis]|uniref:ABM domain-containing protein n=1 Tax=Phyllosticta citribraziliensis TaxID=989973 RepID=A0ABR1MBE2_9PEZI